MAAEIPDDAVWEVAGGIRRLARAVVETAIADFALKPKACEGSAVNKERQRAAAKETAMNFLFSDADEWRGARNFWFGLIGVPEPSLRDIVLVVMAYDPDPRVGREVGSEDRDPAPRGVVCVSSAKDGRDKKEVLRGDKPGGGAAAT